MENILRAQDVMLLEARRNHLQEHPGHHCTVYGNFIECATCRHHVHIIGTRLVQHGRWAKP